MQHQRGTREDDSVYNNTPHGWNGSNDCEHRQILAPFAQFRPVSFSKKPPRDGGDTTGKEDCKTRVGCESASAAAPTELDHGQHAKAKRSTAKSPFHDMIEIL